MENATSYILEFEIDGFTKRHCGDCPILEIEPGICYAHKRAVKITNQKKPPKIIGEETNPYRLVFDNEAADWKRCKPCLDMTARPVKEDPS